MLATTNGAGDAQLSFVWLGDMPIAQIDALGAISYIHPDHLNTPQKMTNAAKTIVWDRQQEPFGETHVTAATVTTPLRFPGQLADAESELNYNMMRDYDPSLGRYIQADPIGLYGASIANANLYGYANQNSLKYVDPQGLNTLLLGGLGLTAKCLSSPACINTVFGIAAGTTGAIAWHNTSPSDDAADQTQEGGGYCTSGSSDPDDENDPQKKGRPKNNQDQNKQVKDAAKQAGLNKEQGYKLSEAIHKESGYGTNLTYQDILEMAKAIKNGTY